MDTKMETEKENEKQNGNEGPTIRITFIGPWYVGKTSLINQIVNNCFLTHYYATSNLEKYKMSMMKPQEEDEDYGRFNDCIFLNFNFVTFIIYV